MIIVTNAVTKEEMVGFACRGRITCLDLHNDKICCGDGSGSLYVLHPTNP
jgi:hypothetical protein